LRHCSLIFIAKPAGVEVRSKKRTQNSSSKEGEPWSVKEEQIANETGKERPDEKRIYGGK
jgi:hypothetical protein